MTGRHLEQHIGDHSQTNFAILNELLPILEKMFPQEILNAYDQPDLMYGGMLYFKQPFLEEHIHGEPDATAVVLDPKLKQVSRELDASW